MKVILIGPVYPYRGGIAHHTHFLDAAFQRANCQTQIISFARQYPAWLYPGKTDRDPSQKERPANAAYLLDALYPWTWLRAARTITAARPDLVAFQWWTTFWSAPFSLISRYLKSRGIPVVYILHNVIPHEARPWDAFLARLALLPAYAHVAQTGKERDKLLALIPGAKVITHPMPMFPLPCAEMPDRAAARQRLGVPENEACLLFFGLVRPYKGLRYLIEALAILRKDGVTPHLIVAGEFWEDLNSYLRQIEALDLAQQIHIFDRYIPDEDIALYFAAADYLVAPYIQGTTQSAAAAAARSFGIPMIITDEIQHGLEQTPSNVIAVVPAADAQALADAIQVDLGKNGPVQKSPKSLLMIQAEDEWDAFAQAILSIAGLQELAQ